MLLKLDLANPTHSFKDRVVAIAAAKARRVRAGDAVGHLDRATSANAVAARAAATGMRAVIFCPAGLEPEKLAATTVYGATVYGVRGSYDDCSRLVSEFAGEVEWGIVNVNLRSYYAEGSKTLAFEIGEQLGWETPDAVVMPIGSGAMFTKVWLGFQQFERLGLIERRAAAALRRPGRGLRARRDRVRRGPARVAGAAELDRARRSRSATRPTATSRSRRRARRAAASTPCPRTRSAPNISLLAEQGGIFGEGATGVALGALREAVRRGELGERDRVVLLVTGTGLKTPQLSSEASGRIVEIDADVDALLEELGSDGVTRRDPSSELREEITALDRELVAAVNRRLETRPAAPRAQGRERDPAARPRARGRDARAALGREPRARCPTAGLAELVQLRARPDPAGAAR